MVFRQVRQLSNSTHLAYKSAPHQRVIPESDRLDIGLVEDETCRNLWPLIHRDYDQKIPLVNSALNLV